MILETGTTGTAGPAAMPSGNVEAILNRKVCRLRTLGPR
jgi:hypothetical protein